jgi:enolase
MVNVWSFFCLFQNNDGSQKISGDSMKNVYKSFVDEYPIFSIEDLFDQDDWVHYAKMTEEIGEQVQIVGGAVAQLALRRALATACGRRRRGGIRPFWPSHSGRRG